MPAEATKPHIMLLPAKDYWDWVQAVREYAVQFGVFVTPRPENAAAFHRPEQVISVIDVPGGYPAYGDIIAWFRQNAPEVTLDVLEALTPAQLRQLLADRIARGLRFGHREVVALRPDRPITLQWPTDYPIIVQPFGAHAEIYRRWGLPGHDGVDIRAPFNSNVYACADGEVYLVHDGSGGHPYGIHVRIRHTGGYKTIYAHLNQALAHMGQVVKAGEVIGLADSTGNSVGSHLHLTLKKEGATAAGETPYPADIIDPTPYLVRRPEGILARRGMEDWPYGRCLVGLHARSGGPMQDADWAVVQAARIEALLLNPASATEDVARARAINPDIFLAMRLTVDFAGRPVSASQFVQMVEDDLGRFYDQGVRYFEVYSEPNLTAQGYGTSWRDGREFGEWFLEVVGLLRPRFPEARFGWPGLAPGPSASGVRFSHDAFLEGAASAIPHADWIGCHCYWDNDAALFSRSGGMLWQHYLDEWPDKHVLITEFSNPAPNVSPHVKGSQYLQYYNLLRRQAGVGAAFAFTVSAVRYYGAEVWRDERGQPTAIVVAVSARDF